MSQYSFVKAANTDRLTQEIQQSSIVTALDYISTVGTALSVFFKAALSASDEITLSALVSSHVDAPLIFTVPPQDVVITGDKPFRDTSGFRARFKGYSGVATKTTTTNIDFQIPAERYINGATIQVVNQVMGDYFSFQIVDIAGLYSTAGTVLDMFAERWYLDPLRCNQGEVVAEYPARIYPGLYIRIIYVSVGTVTDPIINLNMRLHSKTT